MLETNRDLYSAISDLGEHYGAQGRTLEQYLRALLGVARQYQQRQDRDTVSLEDVYQILEQAWIAEPSPFDAAWQVQYSDLNPQHRDFSGWEATLIRQIVDLREMQEVGTLENEQRYFGVDSPRGTRWYNFDPTTYLECAMVGSMGGWEPGDSTGRELVPGEVAILDAQGTLQVVNPEDIDRLIIEVETITWEQFQDFLMCGQMYE